MPTQNKILSSTLPCLLLTFKLYTQCASDTREIENTHKNKHEKISFQLTHIYIYILIAILCFVLKPTVYFRAKVLLLRVYYLIVNDEICILHCILCVHRRRGVVRWIYVLLNIHGITHHHHHHRHRGEDVDVWTC